MSEHTDWTGLIDDCFDHGPGLPPATERLAHGRAALRRRRTTTGAGALAACAVLGLGAVWALPAGGSDVVVAPAGQGDTSPSAPTAKTVAPATGDGPESREDTLGLPSIADGKLVPPPGYEITREEHLDQTEAPDAWQLIAIEMTSSERPTPVWILVEKRSADVIAVDAFMDAPGDYAGFEDWVAAIEARGRQ